jgi:hypothetical protein
LNNKTISKKNKQNNEVKNENKKTTPLTLNNSMIKRNKFSHNKKKIIRIQNKNIKQSLKGKEPEYNIYIINFKIK